MRRAVIESDVVIIGSGISAAMVAERLTRTTAAKITVVEAGEDGPPMPQRAAARERYLRYGENPWGRDHLEGYDVEGPLQARIPGDAITSRDTMSRGRCSRAP
jgi:choline dehydrogenase-like flavoprotein